jgi:hypothetical protein
VRLGWKKRGEKVERSRKRKENNENIVYNKTNTC